MNFFIQRIYPRERVLEVKASQSIAKKTQKDATQYHFVLVRKEAPRST